MQVSLQKCMHSAHAHCLKIKNARDGDSTGRTQMAGNSRTQAAGLKQRDSMISQFRNTSANGNGRHSSASLPSRCLTRHTGSRPTNKRGVSYLVPTRESRLYKARVLLTSQSQLAPVSILKQRQSSKP